MPLNKDTKQEALISFAPFSRKQIITSLYMIQMNVNITFFADSST